MASIPRNLVLDRPTVAEGPNLRPRRASCPTALMGRDFGFRAVRTLAVTLTPFEHARRPGRARVTYDRDIGHVLLPREARAKQLRSRARAPAALLTSSTFNSFISL